MYTQPFFKEERSDVLHALIDAHPLGALVIARADGLGADHLPFEISAPSAAAPFGVLRAHVARANPLWQADGSDALVIFQGPSAYVTPAWYEEKAVSGKVVPTYNYAVVHAHGRLRAVDDPVWLLALLERLTAHHESAHATPWAVADAPRAHIDTLLKALVGIEIVIERLDGKWKASQNRSARDQASIAHGLAEQAATLAMANVMRDAALT